MSTAVASTPPATANIPEGLAKRGLLNRQQAADYLGVAYQTMATWATTGRYDLPYVKVGSRAMYRIEDLDAWIEERMCTQTD